MGEKMNRENYFEFLWPNYSRIIGEGYAEKPLEYPDLFRIEESDSAYEKYKELNGLPVWQENYEGQPINIAERSKGLEITIYNRRFDQGFEVTWEYVNDNKEKLMKGKGFTDEARLLGRGCRVKQEMTTAEIINKGFSNVGYDGVPLFSENHPLTNGDKGSNTTTTDTELNYANLTKAITKMADQRDNTGIKIQVKADKLFVSSDLYFTALTLINSALVPGTSNNDKNVIGKVAPLTVHQMSYFDAGIWLLKDSSIDNLIFLWRETPVFDKERIPGTYDTRVFGLARWGVGYRDWRGLYGVKHTA